MEFNPENKPRFTQLLTRYPNKMAALLPTLWLVQEQEGFISEAAMEYVASLLDISPAHVYGVVTFYTMFNSRPIGKYHIQVCGTLSCALNGSEVLLDRLKSRLGIGLNETTKDGRFTLSSVECLASCGTAPAIMINEKYYENLNPEKLDAILKELA